MKWFIDLYFRVRIYGFYSLGAWQSAPERAVGLFGVAGTAL